MEAARLERQPASWPALWRSRIALRLSPQLLVYVGLFVLICNLVVAPLVMVVATALNIGPVTQNPGLSLDYFRQAWTSPTTWAVLGNTAIFAAGSTVLALSIGVF